MAINVIDTIKQKNNGEFPLVDANDIKGGFYQVGTIDERDLIPLIRRKEGMLCAVKDKIYQLIDGVENVNWVEFKFSDVDKEYVDEKFDSITASSIHIVDAEGNYQSSDVEGALREISDTLNKKIDDIILTDDNFLNFYSNNVLIKSIKIEAGAQVDSEEIENLISTKIDDVAIDTQDGITYIKLFADGNLLKTIEIKTSGDSKIHVGAEAPTADNCEVWLDVSDDEEFTLDFRDEFATEVKTIIDNLKKEIVALKEKVVSHEARIIYLELNGGGSNGGSGGSGDTGNNTTKYIALTLEDGEILTLEDGTILTLEDLSN